MDLVNIYTDGSCSPNPGPGGWGAILVCRGVEKEISGGERDTTNNRMELAAVIEALRALKRPCEAVIHTDSQYVKFGIEQWMSKWRSNGWRTASKKPVQNQDLWRELDNQLARHKAQFAWVPGHTSHRYNERADQLAQKARPS